MMDDKLLNKIYLVLITGLLVLPVFFSGGNNTLVEKLALIIICITGLVGIWINRNKEIKNKIIGILLIFLVILSFVSVIFSVSVYRSMTFWMGELALAVLFWIILQSEFTPSVIEKILKWFLASAIVVSLIGFYFYFFGNYERLTSVFYWPNPMAGYLLLAIPLGFYFVSQRKERWFSLGLIVLLSSFILTGSRGAFLSLIIALFFYSLCRFTEVKKNVWRFVLIVLISIIISLASLQVKAQTGKFFTHYKNSGQAADYSGNTRLYYWRGAMNIAKDNIWNGVGPGMFNFTYPQYQNGALFSGKYAHNFILEILSERGAPATVLLICLLITFLIQGYRASRNNELKFIIFISLIAILIHNLVDIDWHWQANFIIFFILLGLLFTKEENKNDQSKIFWQRSSSIILSILLFTLSIWGIITIFPDFFRLNKIDPDTVRKNNINNYIKCVQNNNTRYCYDSIIRMEQLIKKDKSQSLNYELLGRLYVYVGKNDEAINSFRKAIELDKYNHPEYYRELAQILLLNNKRDEAKKVLEEILSYYPESVTNYKQMIIMEGQGDTTATSKEIEQIKYLLTTLK